jgi:hypothetical protein
MRSFVMMFWIPGKNLGGKVGGKPNVSAGRSTANH